MSNISEIASETGTVSLPIDVKFCYFMASYIGMVVFVGVVMNMIVILSFFRFYKDVDPYSMLVCSQGFCDLLSPLLAYPMSFTSSINCSWLYGPDMCQYYGFITSFTGYTSMFNLAALSVERFVTIRFPLRRETLLKKRNVAIGIALVWIFGILWGLIPFLGISAYVKEGLGTMCSVRWHSSDRRDFHYCLSLILGAYFLPMVVIFLCYKCFLNVIYSIMPTARILANPDLNIDFTSVEKQQTFIVMLMVLWYNIAWFPYAVVAFVCVIGYPELISPKAASLPQVFAKTSNIANPIIYCFISKGFRNAVFKGNKVSPSE